MYIVYDTNDNLDQLRSKYLVLELDTLEFSERLVTAFSVIDNEHIPLSEVGRLTEFSNLHANLIKNYRNRDWNYCEEAISHLLGKFKGEMDSFYAEFLERIEILKDATLQEDWTGNVVAQIE